MHRFEYGRVGTLVLRVAWLLKTSTLSLALHSSDDLMLYAP
jgi:hypothetical protein